MAINPNSAFVRVMFDLPTPLAIKLDEACQKAGVSKKKFLADMIESNLNPKKGKR